MEHQRWWRKSNKGVPDGNLLLMWAILDKCTHQWTVPLGKPNNVAMLQFAPGFTKSSAFCTIIGLVDKLNNPNHCWSCVSQRQLKQWQQSQLEPRYAWLARATWRWTRRCSGHLRGLPMGAFWRYSIYFVVCGWACCGTMCAPGCNIRTYIRARDYYTVKYGTIEEYSACKWRYCGCGK